jgi:hypothetical protein
LRSILGLVAMSLSYKATLLAVIVLFFGVLMVLSQPDTSQMHRIYDTLSVSAPILRGRAPHASRQRSVEKREPQLSPFKRVR